MKSNRRVDQYLAHYVLEDSREAACMVLASSAPRFARSLCIPLYDETADALERVLIHPNVTDTLLILVVNSPSNAPEPAQKRTALLLKQLTERGNHVAQSRHASLRAVSGSHGVLHVLVMDHCSPGRQLPVKEGVGRARKLATDVALELWQNGRVRSDWLYQSDADATLPEHYFDTPTDYQDCAAVHLNFRHVAPGETSVAQKLYDLKLDHYVAGLACAGSPYAHYSLGSALVINACAYATVRGFPRRSAGEDFYLLNKLAKIGTIQFDASRAVVLEERLSSRVPFGTGPGVQHFCESAAPFALNAYHSPDAYRALKRWLDFLNDVLIHTDYGTDKQVGQRYGDYACVTPSSIEMRALDKMGLFAWAEKVLCAYRAPDQRKRQFMTGMDGLKTLQLIHAFRDHGYHNVAAAEAVQSLQRFHASLDSNKSLRSNRYRSLILV